MLAPEDVESVDRTLRKIYRLQDLDGFVVAAMQELPGLMQSDVAAYNEVDYPNRRMLTVIDSSDMQSFYHRLEDHFGPLMNQNPLIEHNSRAIDQPRKISDFLTDAEWRSTEVYKTFYSVAHGNYQIAVALPTDGNSIVAFAFNRAASDFTEREREILTVLQPHLTQAYSNARAYAASKNRLKRSEQVLEAIGAGWIELDASLNVTSATPLARDNIATFFDTTGLSLERLPPALESWVSEHGAAGATGPIAPLTVRGPRGRLILRLMADQGTSGLSLLTERFLDAPSPKPLENLGLTKRQAEVLYWISQGKSNAEIAVMLKITIRTVVHHVSLIFERLDLSNRTEAAQVAAAHLMSRG